MTTVTDHRERMHQIAKRVAEALGVELRVLTGNTTPLIYPSSRDRACWWDADQPSVAYLGDSKHAKELFSRFRWPSPYAIDAWFGAERYIGITMFTWNGVFQVASVGPMIYWWDPFTPDIRAKLQRIDAALDGLLSYGIERGGDEALREWWRER